MKTETESSLLNVMFLNKDRIMDNVKNCDSYAKSFNSFFSWNTCNIILLSFRYFPTHKLLLGEFRL
jgi:hypothetical protein